MARVPNPYDWEEFIPDKFPPRRKVPEEQLTREPSSARMLAQRSNHSLASSRLCVVLDPPGPRRHVTDETLTILRADCSLIPRLHPVADSPEYEH